MELHNQWPKELQTHFWRLDANYRDFIVSRLAENTSNQNILMNFISVIDNLIAANGSYMSNSEFIFLAAAVKLIQGKSDAIQNLCCMDEFHPGLHNAKAFSLISQRKFSEVPTLIKNAKDYAKDVDPYNYIYALANELLMLYYTGVFGIIEDKIAILTKEFDHVMAKLPEGSKTRLAVTEAFILGNSVAISLKRREGKLEEGSRIGKNLIAQARKTENRYLLNRLLNNTALCLIESGNLREGLKYLEEAFEFSETMGNPIQLSIGANNIGFIYRNMGNLEQAMRYFYIALEHSKNANIAPYIIATETNIAHLHLDFGNPKLALNDSEIALESLLNSDVPVPPQIKIALDLCRADIYEQLEDFDEVKNTLNHALGIVKPANLNKEIPKINIRFARIAAKQQNLGDANEKLTEALAYALENNLYEIVVNAKLQLAEIDLLRYRMTNQNLLLLAAYEKILDAEQLCLEQDYKLILIDVYILKGLLLSLNNKKKEGKKALEKAISLAQELKIQEKEQEARNQLGEIENEKKSLLVRIFTRINKSIRSTIAFESVTSPKTIETEIHALFLITRTSGLPFYQMEFSDNKKIDSGLLSGLLSAIRTMSQTILDAKEGGLKLIDHGEVAIMLETREKLFFALVVSKETYLIREKLRLFADKLSDNVIIKAIDEDILTVTKKQEELIESLAVESFK